MITLLNITTNADYLIEQVARVSHNSQMKSDVDKEFLERIIKLGHLSVLEHASATFYIDYISRACSHQLVRHRHFSFCQMSQRYVKQKSSFILPPTIKEKLLDIPYSQKINVMFDFYEYLIRNGASKEDARYVLPNACKTELVMTGNFRSYRELFQKRINDKAQWEIRELCQSMYDILYKQYPVLFKGSII